MAGIVDRLMRMLAAMLLALCVASPAVAEIGCSWDTATHFADRGEHEPEGGGDSSEPAPDSHCAFSHGHGSLASAAADPVVPARILSFALPVAARFVSSLLPGLDRPPRA